MSDPTPTPAPALTDEQIDVNLKIIRDCAASLTRAVSAPGLVDRTVAAVIARAKREERRRLWHAINPLMDGVTEESVSERLCSHLINITIVEAYRLGVATALMETVKESTR